jgi:hypothetical protein
VARHARALPKYEHLEDVLWNDPDVQGTCFQNYTLTGDGYDNFTGCQDIHYYDSNYDPSVNLAPYVVLNNHQTSQQADPCGFAYVGTGEVGPGHNISIQIRRQSQINSPLLPNDWTGLVIWTYGWVQPTPTAAGWTMLDLGTVLPGGDWYMLDSEKFFFSDGTLAGWWRTAGRWPAGGGPESSGRCRSRAAGGTFRASSSIPTARTWRGERGSSAGPSSSRPTS